MPSDVRLKSFQIDAPKTEKKTFLTSIRFHYNFFVFPTVHNVNQKKVKLNKSIIY